MDTKNSHWPPRTFTLVGDVTREQLELSDTDKATVEPVQMILNRGGDLL